MINKPMTKTSYVVGDDVYIQCVSGHGTGGMGKITSIDRRFDCETGEPYPIVCTGNNHWFHGIHGYAITDPTGYYIPKKDGRNAE